MNWEEYSKRFEAEAKKRGRSSEFIARSLTYAEALVQRNMPIIFDFAHLSALLGFEPAALKSSLSSPECLYKTYHIPKRNGAFRRIDEPLPSLQKIQLWILRNILDRCVPSNIAMAFVKQRSIKHNAEIHLGRQMILSLDLKDFFPSISTPQVRSIFADLGFSTSVVDALTQMTVLENGLPQGAPTSPSLSNLILKPFDERLKRFALRLGVRCSRYADDITISGIFRVGEVVAGVRKLLLHYGFRLNDEKTRLMRPHERQEVTGVIVNHVLQAPRSVRRALRKEIYFIRKHGFPEHESECASAYENRRAHLQGIAEFILFLNPNDRDAKQAVLTLGRVRYPR